MIALINRSWFESSVQLTLTVAHNWLMRSITMMGVYDSRKSVKCIPCSLFANSTSHRINAWQKGNASQLWGPIICEMCRIGISLFFPFWIRSTISWLKKKLMNSTTSQFTVSTYAFVWPYSVEHHMRVSFFLLAWRQISWFGSEYNVSLCCEEAVHQISWSSWLRKWDNSSLFWQSLSLGWDSCSAPCSSTSYNTRLGLASVYGFHTASTLLVSTSGSASMVKMHLFVFPTNTGRLGFQDVRYCRQF